MTTFITPFSRYYYNRLPFGITSAPEHFHRRVSKIFTGAVSMIDDVLDFDKNEKVRFKELG